jgi:para-nitrobenzyl esterase
MKQTEGNLFRQQEQAPCWYHIADAPSSCTSKPQQDDGQVLFIGDNIAVADTAYGKVRGYILRDIYYFLGIPYGADTSGANRFLAPKKPEPWANVFPAVWWGNTAPQNMENRYANKYQSFQDHWNYDDVSENCLTINVFTPAVNDGARRPVMLWLHGGGFTSGSGIEQDSYYGENFARLGNVVFCSVNHRLCPMGFSNFAGIDSDKYGSSGNAGMLDIVAALEWIRITLKTSAATPAMLPLWVSQAVVPKLLQPLPCLLPKVFSIRPWF